jgi:hypothetical protein
VEPLGTIGAGRQHSYKTVDNYQSGPNLKTTGFTEPGEWAPVELGASGATGRQWSHWAPVELGTSGATGRQYSWAPVEPLGASRAGHQWSHWAPV